MVITKHTLLIPPNTSQDYFNSLVYIYMHTTCFDLCLDHPQVCQHKNHTKEDTLCRLTLLYLHLNSLLAHNLQSEFKMYYIKEYATLRPFRLRENTPIHRRI